MIQKQRKNEIYIKTSLFKFLFGGMWKEYSLLYLFFLLVEITVENMGKIVFHHYTTPAAAKAIAQSGIIKKSVRKPGQNPDCCYGEGTYGTPLDPSFGRKALAQNNYAINWEANEERGKVDFVIRIVMDDSKVIHKSERGREIYIHDGDIILNEADEVDFIEVLGRGKLNVKNYK